MNVMGFTGMVGIKNIINWNGGKVGRKTRGAGWDSVYFPNNKPGLGTNRRSDFPIQILIKSIREGGAPFQPIPPLFGHRQDYLS
jgi:hypothetical protein